MNDSNTTPENDPVTAAFDNLVERRTATTNIPLALQQVESGQPTARNPWLIFGPAALLGSAAIIALVFVLTNGPSNSNVELPTATNAPATTGPTAPSVDNPPTTVTAIEGTATTLEFESTTTPPPPTTGPPKTIAPVTFALGSPEAAIQAQYGDPARYVGQCVFLSNLSSDTEVCSVARDGTDRGATIHDVFLLADVGQATDFGGGFYLRLVDNAWTVVDSFSLGESFRVDNNGVVTIDILGERSEIWRPANPTQYRPPVQTSLYNTTWFSVEEPEPCGYGIYQVRGGEVTLFADTASDPAIDPTGRYLAYLVPSADVIRFDDCTYDVAVVRDLVTGQEQRSVVTEEFGDFVSLRRPRWSPSGALLVVDFATNQDELSAAMFRFDGGAIRRQSIIVDRTQMVADLEAATENLDVRGVYPAFDSWTATGGYLLDVSAYALEASAIVEFDNDGNYVGIVSVDDRATVG